MSIIWTDDEIFDDPNEQRHEQLETCEYCGYDLDDTRLKRRRGWFHESCLQRMADMGGISE